MKTSADNYGNTASLEPLFSMSPTLALCPSVSPIGDHGKGSIPREWRRQGLLWCSQVGAVRLRSVELTVSPFLGRIRAPIGSIAGGIPSTFAGAESAAMDGKTSDTVEGIISSGATKGVVLAEASLQALSKVEHDPGSALSRDTKGHRV